MSLLQTVTMGKNKMSISCKKFSSITIVQKYLTNTLSYLKKHTSLPKAHFTNKIFTNLPYCHNNLLAVADISFRLHPKEIKKNRIIQLIYGENTIKI